MTYFLFAVLVLVIAALLALHVSQTRDWREERALLMQAVIAKNSSEFRSMVQGVPAEPAVPRANDFWENVEGYVEPVGL